MYSSLHRQTLISRILAGDKLAAKEFIKRHQERGYNLNPIVSNVNNPLFQLIVRHQHTAIALEFIEQEVNINTQDKLGMTPLHEAAITGNKILVEQLLEKGANPFTRDIDGITAEMLAEHYGHKELAFRLRSSLLFKLLKHTNVSFSSDERSQKSKSRDEPLDLSKTGPNATNVKLLFFKPNKSSSLILAEKIFCEHNYSFKSATPEHVTIEIDPNYVFWVKKFIL
jgi:ankyrin repeat protein